MLGGRPSCSSATPLPNKYGGGECTAEGRLFTDYDEELIAKLAEAVPGLGVEEVWVTNDVRSERAGQRWTNVLFRASDLL